MSTIWAAASTKGDAAYTEASVIPESISVLNQSMGYVPQCKAALLRSSAQRSMSPLISRTCIS